MSPGANGEINSERDVAKDFLAFWGRFMTTFGLQGRKVYITGESYAGQYIPYLAAAMLDENNTEYYNLAGIQINDPSINDGLVMSQGQFITYKVYQISMVIERMQHPPLWL